MSYQQHVSLEKNEKEKAEGTYYEKTGKWAREYYKQHFGNEHRKYDSSKWADPVSRDDNP